MHAHAQNAHPYIGRKSAAWKKELVNFILRRKKRKKRVYEDVPRSDTNISVLLANQSHGVGRYLD
jgi:hypothetical protein